MSRDTGGAAFPGFPAQRVNRDGKDQFVTGESGMSLRDYFAAAALPGCARQFESGVVVIRGRQTPQQAIAAAAYQIADAMLVVRQSPADPYAGLTINGEPFNEEGAP